MDRQGPPGLRRGSSARTHHRLALRAGWARGALLAHGTVV